MAPTMGQRIEAYADPVIFRDDRVLLALLGQESAYVPTPAGREDENSTRMRKNVADWMLEVCEEEGCRPEVFCLAMNYVDRFVGLCPVRKSPQLQLLGAVCLLVASKLRRSRPLAAAKLVEYSNFSLDVDDIREWEVMLLSTLQWDMSAVVACDFVEHILQRLRRISGGRHSPEVVRPGCENLIVACTAHHVFSTLPASLVAAGCILTALSHASETVMADTVDFVGQITFHEPESLRSCMSQIDSILGRDDSSNKSRHNHISTPTKKINNANMGTPTKLLDVAKDHC